MKVVIIEDEPLVANDIAKCILNVDNRIQIIAILPSIVESIEWFQNNENPDLIFSDIQLTDGLSFEIFKNIACAIPIIFCTAYDEFALNAFKANGVDYILKPITKNIIAEALNKYTLLKENISKNVIPYDNITKLYTNNNTQVDNTILVYFKNEILPVYVNNIALFYIENEVSYIITFAEKKYIVNKSIDELGKLTNNEFYRVNRQYLINRKAIKKAHKCSDFKLLISLKISFAEPIKVRKEKISEFLTWLSKY